MKEFGKFYKPEEIKILYGEIVPVYQAAFKGEPWFEVSKCTDSATVQKCVSGLSSLPVGQTCELCGNCLARTAYEKEELVDRFEILAQTRPTVWYVEKNNVGVTLAAVAWSATPSVIADEKYPNAPEIKEWMISKLGKEPIVWLDDIFADRNKKQEGNLKNFGLMCNGLLNRLRLNTLTYRTINERMTRVAARDFGEQSRVFQRNIEVPDRRDFVVINGGSKR